MLQEYDDLPHASSGFQGFLDYPKRSLLDSYEEEDGEEHDGIGSESDEDDSYQQEIPCRGASSFQMRLGSLYGDMGLAVESAVKSFGSSKCRQQAAQAMKKNPSCCKKSSCAANDDTKKKNPFDYDTLKKKTSLFSLGNFQGSFDSSHQSTEATQEESAQSSRESWEESTRAGHQFSKFMTLAKQDLDKFALEALSFESVTDASNVSSLPSFVGKEDGSITTTTINYKNVGNRKHVPSPPVASIPKYPHMTAMANVKKVHDRKPVRPDPPENPDSNKKVDKRKNADLVESMPEYPIILGTPTDVGDGCLLRTRSNPEPTKSATVTAPSRSRSFASANLARIAVAFNRQKLHVASASCDDAEEKSVVSTWSTDFLEDRWNDDDGSEVENGSPDFKGSPMVPNKTLSDILEEGESQPDDLTKESSTMESLKRRPDIAKETRFGHSNNGQDTRGSRRSRDNSNRNAAAKRIDDRIRNQDRVDTPRTKSRQRVPEPKKTPTARVRAKSRQRVPEPKKTPTTRISLLPSSGIKMVKKRLQKSDIKDSDPENHTRTVIPAQTTQKGHRIRTKFAVVSKLCHKLRRSSSTPVEESCKTVAKDTGNITNEPEKRPLIPEKKMSATKTFAPVEAQPGKPQVKDRYAVPSRHEHQTNKTEKEEECIVFVEGSSETRGYSLQKRGACKHYFDQTTIAPTQECVEVTSISRPVSNADDNSVIAGGMESARAVASHSQLDEVINDASPGVEIRYKPAENASDAALDIGKKMLMSRACEAQEERSRKLAPGIGNEELKAHNRTFHDEAQCLPTDEEDCKENLSPTPKQKGWRNKLLGRTASFFGRKTSLERQDAFVKDEMQEDNILHMHRQNVTRDEMSLEQIQMSLEQIHVKSMESLDAFSSVSGDTKSSTSFSFSSHMKKLSMLQVISVIHEEMRRLEQQANNQKPTPFES